MAVAGDKMDAKIRESSKELLITLSLSWPRALPLHQYLCSTNLQSLRTPQGLRWVQRSQKDLQGGKDLGAKMET